MSTMTNADRPRLRQARANHRRWGWPAALALLTVTACATRSPSEADTSAPDSSTLDARADVGAPVDTSAPVDAGAPGDAPQPESTVFELIVFSQAGHATRLYVPVTFEDKPGLMLLDTGSQLTFVLVAPELWPPGGADYAANWATVTLGEEALSVGGRPHNLQESHLGTPVIGIIGNDLMQAHPWEIDLAGGKLIRHTARPDTSDWAKLAYDNVYDFFFTWVTIDGTKVRLVIDTGAPHTLWLGQPGAPGDEVVPSQDGYGNPITFYQRDSEVAFAGQPATSVPVLRTTSFPSLEDSNKRAGFDVDGLLGLSSLAVCSRLIFDAPNTAIWLACGL